MEKNIKKKLREYINSQNQSLVVVNTILSYRLQDFDDDNGVIGENYIIEFNGTRIIITNFGSTEVELVNVNAYLNVNAFKKWQSGNKLIEFNF